MLGKVSSVCVCGGGGGGGGGGVGALSSALASVFKKRKLAGIKIFFN